MLLTNSVLYNGNGAITLGRLVVVYPVPAFVIVVPAITPFVIVAVAVAVVPPPTGAATERLVEAPTYPRPPSTIVNPDT